MLATCMSTRSATTSSILLCSRDRCRLGLERSRSLHQGWGETRFEGDEVPKDKCLTAPKRRSLFSNTPKDVALPPSGCLRHPQRFPWHHVGESPPQYHCDEVELQGIQDGGEAGRRSIDETSHQPSSISSPKALQTLLFLCCIQDHTTSSTM